VVWDGWELIQANVDKCFVVRLRMG
jgi:hypothetical protein